MSKLWFSTAKSPFDNSYGSITVIASTREQAREKAVAEIKRQHSNYVPNQMYLRNLLENLDLIEVATDAFIDFTAVRSR